jgi:hypothetical protein
MPVYIYTSIFFMNFNKIVRFLRISVGSLTITNIPKYTLKFRLSKVWYIMNKNIYENGKWSVCSFFSVIRHTTCLNIAIALNQQIYEIWIFLWKIIYIEPLTNTINMDLWCIWVYLGKKSHPNLFTYLHLEAFSLYWIKHYFLIIDRMSFSIKSCDFLPKYTQIHHKIVFIVLVKGSIWIIIHKKIQIS